MDKIRVLIAEDNLTDQFVIRRMLEGLDCLVDVVPNGFEAVDAVRRHHYDLVVMEEVMPGLSGTEATRIIRELPGKMHLPVVAITRDASLCRHCLQAGMDDFLVKPVAMYKFAEIIDKHVIERMHPSGVVLSMQAKIA